MVSIKAITVLSVIHINASLAFLKYTAINQAKYRAQHSNTKVMPFESKLKLTESGFDLWKENPESLCKATLQRPRLAKDKAYAVAVQNAWKEESRIDLEKSNDFVSDSPCTYECEEEDGSMSTLYGHIYRPNQSIKGTESKSSLNPAVILFHTAAGPHDVYLHWKAHTLAVEKGYTVLIADVLSDKEGWAWDDDRTKYQTAKDYLFFVNNGKRDRLRRRIRAGLLTLTNIEGVDKERIGAIGWCFGGQIALEVVNMQMNVEGLKALATFHGVFSGADALSMDTDASKSTSTHLPRVLICNGVNDPFVPQGDKLHCQNALINHDWEWVDYENCLHGFSNPAQATNPNPNFDYNENAARKSWDFVCKLLHETIG